MATTRTCFVIMPFSSTPSCTEDEWTDVYDNLIEPAVVGAGLGFACHRSVATRGNIIKGILSELGHADVVIADLTDRNPNVMYELGVRHVLAGKTIIIAQDRQFIPFDLQAYANHTYGWKTAREKQEFKNAMPTLLLDVIKRPDYEDNPVADFLRDVLVHQPSFLEFFEAVKDGPQFKDLLVSAHSEVFAVGPNLLYVAQNLKEHAFAKAKQGVSIRFLMMALDAQQPMPVRLVGEYASITEFPEELTLCHRTFGQWMREAAVEGLDMEVRLAPFIPLSLNILDPETDDGRMLVIPHPYRTASADRPCILFKKKKYPHAFSLFYRRFNEYWERAAPLPY